MLQTKAAKLMFVKFLWNRTGFLGKTVADFTKPSLGSSTLRGLPYAACLASPAQRALPLQPSTQAKPATCNSIFFLPGVGCRQGKH